MQSGYVGIFNQGSTCYLNSVIQSLFHLPAFRTEIFNLPNVEKDAVTLALRDIFAQLELRNRSITTTELTKAFGWSAQEAAVQHDVHELVQQLFDSLETALKDTPNKNLIRDFFGGLMVYRSRAVDGADYVSDRLEDLYDVELVVQDKANIEESLQQFSSGEKIEGVSVELTPGAAPTSHVIERSQHFLDCPKVLLIHPNRVAFDMETYELVTLRNVWEFDPVLTLSNYLVDEKTLKLDKESKEKMAKITHRTHLGASYTLRSILTHAGDANIGHYYVYVNFEDEWVRFNDEIVEAATVEEVRKSAFGGQSTQSRYRLFDNERASLLLYVNDDVKEEVLREVPPPEAILDLARSIEDERTRVLETRKFYYYVCDEKIVDVFDGVHGAVDRLLRVLSARVPQGSAPSAAIVSALAVELGVEASRIRLYYHDRSQLRFWTSVEEMRYANSNHFPYLYVNIQPTKAEERAEEVGAETATSSPFLVYLRGVSNAQNLEVPVKVLRSFADLRRALPGSCPVYTYHCSSSLPREITSQQELVLGDNLLYCDAPNPNKVVKEFVHNRLMIKTIVYVYDEYTGTEKEAFWLRVEESTPYNKLQEILFNELKNSKVKYPTAPTPSHICFFRPESKTSYAFSMPVQDTYPMQQGDFYMTLGDLWSRGENSRKLVMTILPAPLESIDLSMRVIFNGGFKNMPHVYLPVGLSTMTFRELLQLAVNQLGGHMRDNVLVNYTDQLAGKAKALRLLWVVRGEAKAIVEDDDEAIHLVRHGNLVLDKLSPTLPGYVRYDVLFCRRRSGERFFGLPTNIIVNAELCEQGDVVLRRIVKKLGYPDLEEAMKKWILCVMNTTTRKTRTAGMKEVLADLVKDIGGAPFVFVVDRPPMLLLDGVDEEGRHQDSIVIKSTSKTDLSAL